MRGRPRSIVAAMLMACVVTALVSLQADKSTSKPQRLGPKQVLTNVALMKFIVEPYHVDLSRGMQAEPENRPEWRSLYFRSQRMGEAMNLLFFREGKDYMGTPDWNRMANTSREAAVAVANACEDHDYDRALAGYTSLVESCNACHKKFEPDDPTLVVP